MNILTMLWKNLWGGNRTLQFPARPTIGQRFRGLVKFDADKCIGCGICKNRCTSRAIEFKGGKTEYTWSYDPGQCTFCGRCIEGCKDGAIWQEENTPPIYTTYGELKETHTMQRKPPAARAAAAAKPTAPVVDAAATAAAVPAAPAVAPESPTGGAQ